MCHVLVIEDCEADFEQIRRQLSGRNPIASDITWTRSIKETKHVTVKPDIIILDITLPDSTDLTGLTRIAKHFPDIPIILHTGRDNDKTAIEALRNGAQDYVIKGEDKKHLIKALRYAQERNRLQVLLKKEKEKVAKASEAKTRYFSKMAHELRTPLSSVLAYADMLNNTELSSEQFSSVNSIKRNGEHLLKVINNILDFSKLEAGTVKTNIEKIPVNTFCNELIEDFEQQAKEKKLFFSLSKKGKIPDFFETDPFLLRQVIINLLGNALKFTHKGGITLYLTFDKQLSLEVIDTGIGIATEELDQLFKPFSQANSSVARNFGGTGLGLAICKDIVKKLKGEIKLKSAPGVGTSFTVTVPAKFIFKKAAISQEVHRYTPRFKGKVLVVDDLEDNRDIMSYYLKRCGLDVSSAENGVEALEEVERNNFNLIMMDMQMPIMDGATCVQNLRERGAALPIVAFSANIKNKQQVRACDDLLSKPFKSNELYTVLSKFLHDDQSNSDLTDIEGSAAVIQKFTEGLPNRLRTIEESFHRQDWDELKLHAHRIAGAGLFGYNNISFTAKALEKAANAKETQECSLLIKRVKLQISEVIR